jgi:hypothetical protein
MLLLNIFLRSKTCILMYLSVKVIDDLSNFQSAEDKKMDDGGSQEVKDTKAVFSHINSVD